MNMIMKISPEFNPDFFCKFRVTLSNYEKSIEETSSLSLQLTTRLSFTSFGIITNFLPCAY